MVLHVLALTWCPHTFKPCMCSTLHACMVFKKVEHGPAWVPCCMHGYGSGGADKTHAYVCTVYMLLYTSINIVLYYKFSTVQNCPLPSTAYPAQCTHSYTVCSMCTVANLHSWSCTSRDLIGIQLYVYTEPSTKSKEWVVFKWSNPKIPLCRYM